MKYLNLIFAILFISCQGGNDDNNQNAKTFTDAQLNVQEIINYLPENYISESKIVFATELGDKKTLEVNYTESEVQREFHGKKYVTQNIEANLFDPEPNVQFSINLTGSTNFDFNGNIVKGLNASLMPFVVNDAAFQTILFVDGKPEINVLSDFHQSLTLNDIEFREVYRRFEERFESFSELDLNKEVGVVAFRDEDNILWVFDHFE